MNDDYLKFLSQLEQAGESIKEVAKFLAGYFRQLCESGLERREALMLTRDMQMGLLDQAFGGIDEGFNPGNTDDSYEGG